MAESNRIFDLITPFVNQVQDIEYVLDDLRKKRNLYTYVDPVTKFVSAEGAQLDGIGEIVGVARLGRSDADYAKMIQVTIVLNLSSGQPDKMIQYFNLITGSNIQYTEPATATVRIEMEAVPSPVTLLGQVDRIKPAGVGIEYIRCGTFATSFSVDTEGTMPDTDGFGFLEDSFAEGPYTAGELVEDYTIY